MRETKFGFGVCIFPDVVVKAFVVVLEEGRVRTVPSVKLLEVQSSSAYNYLPLKISTSAYLNIFTANILATCWMFIALMFSTSPSQLSRIIPSEPFFLKALATSRPMRLGTSSFFYCSERCDDELGRL